MKVVVAAPLAKVVAALMVSFVAVAEPAAALGSAAAAAEAKATVTAWAIEGCEWVKMVVDRGDSAEDQLPLYPFGHQQCLPSVLAAAHPSADFCSVCYDTPVGKREGVQLGSVDTKILTVVHLRRLNDFRHRTSF